MHKIMQLLKSPSFYLGVCITLLLVAIILLCVSIMYPRSSEKFSEDPSQDNLSLNNAISLQEVKDILVLSPDQSASMEDSALQAKEWQKQMSLVDTMMEHNSELSHS